MKYEIISDKKQHKKKNVFTALNNIEQLLKLASDIIDYLSISSFTLLVGIPIGIAGLAVGLKTCAVTGRIKNYESIVQKIEKI